MSCRRHLHRRGDLAVDDAGSPGGGQPQGEQLLLEVVHDEQKR